mmetsp:Transcript_8544/g.34746  ORF Transcript_8544/g.34746 Transcript_8544/m.34746 type:complete len:301 (-) Transcript_8544:3787-4689(-)
MCGPALDSACPADTCYGRSSCSTAARSSVVERREVCAASAVCRRARLRHECAVHPAGLLHEVLRRVELRDVAVRKHHDAIRVGDRVEAVRDGENSAVLEDLAEGLLQDGVRFDVAAGGGLVEHHHLCALKKGTRRAYELPLPVAPVLPILCNHAVQTAAGDDEVVEVHVPQGLHHGKVGVAARRVEVEAHGPAKKLRLLRNEREPRAKGAQRQLVDVLAVYRQPALVDVGKPQQRAHERALSRPRASADTDLLTRLDVEAHGLEHTRQALAVRHRIARGRDGAAARPRGRRLHAAGALGT